MRLTFFIVTICISVFCSAQSDFRKGYVITNSGDTIFGFVDYREGHQANKSCSFKSSLNQVEVKYEPASIIGYGFQNDKFFQSREITIKDEVPQVVFIEVLVKGIASLYKFEGTFFLEKNNEGLQQLISETEIVYIDGKDFFSTTNQHITTINMLLFDCIEIRSRIRNIRLEEKALTELVEAYNLCKGEPGIIYKAKKPWTKIIPGMIGGFNASRLTIDTKDGYKHLAGAFETSKSPMAGVSLDISFPRQNERFSIHSEILYFSSKYYNYNLIYNTITTERNYVSIKLQQINIPIGIRYTFSERNFTPYFNFGMYSTIPLSSSQEWILEKEYDNIVETYENTTLAISKYQMGLWGGCGFIKSINNKVTGFVEFRYEQAPSIYGNDNLHSKIKSFQILIGIRTK